MWKLTYIVLYVGLNGTWSTVKFHPPENAYSSLARCNVIAQAHARGLRSFILSGKSGLPIKPRSDIYLIGECKKDADAI